MINQDAKNKVIAALQLAAKDAISGNKHAISLELNSSIYSRLLNGDTEKVLSESEWLRLARQVDVNLKNTPAWVTAHTPTYEFITSQLYKCQNDAISCILCDEAGIGKTYTAKAYVKSNRMAVYIDCSQVKTKQKLVRAIAKAFGVEHKGKYDSVYKDLMYYLNNSLESPLVVLDEAGDLSYDAFLELKGLWNATERNCGWCMMGADGLKEKMRRAIAHKKVGYTEIFSRFGSRYQRITPEGKEEHLQFSITQAALVIQANAPKADVKQMLRNSENSLRRVYHEISKRKAS